MQRLAATNRARTQIKKRPAAIKVAPSDHDMEPYEDLPVVQELMIPDFPEPQVLNRDLKAVRKRLEQYKLERLFGPLFHLESVSCLRDLRYVDRDPLRGVMLASSQREALRAAVRDKFRIR